MRRNPSYPSRLPLANGLLFFLFLPMLHAHAQIALEVKESDAGNHDLLSPFSLILLTLLMLTVIGQALYIRKLHADKRSASDHQTEGQAASGQSETAPQSKAASDSHAIELMLMELTACVREMLEATSTYQDRMADHRAAIDQSLMLTNLEEVKKKIMLEIESMRATQQTYHQQLEEAQTRLATQQAQLEKLQSEATIDFLTQVGNRRAFDERLQSEFERARRYHSPLGLLMLDIDHFKKVNDTYGHPAGDKLLQLVAHILKQEIRSSDYLARYGGEEFAIILPETAENQITRVAEKMRASVAGSKLRYEDQSISVTISIGATTLDAKDTTPDLLLSRTDAALYDAKKGGRDRVVYINETKLKA